MLSRARVFGGGNAKVSSSLALLAHSGLGKGLQSAFTSRLGEADGVPGLDLALRLLVLGPFAETGFRGGGRGGAVVEVHV